MYLLSYTYTPNQNKNSVEMMLGYQVRERTEDRDIVNKYTSQYWESDLKILNILRYGMSVLTVSPYRPKTAFRYLAVTNVLAYTHPWTFFAVLKCRVWSSTFYFLLNVRKCGFVLWSSLQGCSGYIMTDWHPYYKKKTICSYYPYCLWHFNVCFGNSLWGFC